MATVLIAAGLVVPFTPPVNPDISWLSYSADRFLHGAVPYVDLIEINPPAILFFNLPAAWLAEVTAVDGPDAYFLYVCALALASVASTRRLLGPLLTDDRLGLDLLTLLLLLALFTLTGRHFGQREHVMLTLALPYLAAASLRMGGRSISAAAACGVGLVAGIGFALKPHFLLVWLAVETLIWAKGRSMGLTPFRSENLALGAVLVLYAISIPMVTPEFFSLTARLGDTYLGYLNGSIADHLSQPAVLFVAVATLAIIATPVPDGWRAVVQVLGVSALAMLLMAGVQLKAWSYHYYPAFATAVVLLGLVAARGRGAIGFDVPGVARLAAAGTVTIGALGALVALPGIVDASHDRRVRLQTVVSRIERYCEAPRLVILSPDASSSFPLATHGDFTWGLRISHLWPLSAAYEERADDELPLQWREPSSELPVERFVHETVTADLTTAPPDLLMVDERSSRRSFGSSGFEYLGYFSRSAEFRALLQDYRLVGHWVGYETRVRSDSEACRGDARDAP